MTIGVQEHTVVCFIPASRASPDDLMALPSCQFGNFPLAQRAEATLVVPALEHLPFPFQVVCPFHRETLFQVGLPFGLVRVGCTLDFDVSFNGATFCLTQSKGLQSPLLPKDFAMKDPVLPFKGGEVLLLTPCDGFLGRAPLCPLPPGAKDGVLHL